MIVSLTWQDMRVRIRLSKAQAYKKWYGVPRGGSVVAAMSGRAVDTPEEADCIVDDIYDSGKTKRLWRTRFPLKPFIVMVDKRNEFRNDWVEFPWEKPGDVDIEDSVIRLLQFVGEDAARDGLRDTPKRVVKALKEMTCGYDQDPALILKRDFDGDGYDEMICTKRLQVVSICEHHMLPFTGHAWIAYVPNKRVVGLSKMSRLLKCYMRRLQIQERLTKQVAEAMMKHLKPLGVGVMIDAVHSCMSCRGVMEPESSMVTTALTGVFKRPAVRMEFLHYCK